MFFETEYLDEGDENTPTRRVEGEPPLIPYEFPFYHSRPMQVAVQVIGVRPAGGMGGYRLHLRDLRQWHEFLTVPMTDSDMLHYAQAAMERGQRLLLSGMLVPEKEKRRSAHAGMPLRVQLERLEFLQGAGPLVGMTASEQAAADEAIDRLAQKEGALEEHLHGELRRAIQEPTDRAPNGFQLSERALLLQALSGGGDLPPGGPPRLPRLSLVTFADSLKGRLVLAQEAEALAPRSFTINPWDIYSPRPESKSGAKGRSFDPGFFGVYAGGACVVPEAARIPGEAPRHYAALREVLDGALRPQGEGPPMPVDIALLLQCRRDSVLQALAPPVKEGGLVLPLGLLLRADLVLDLGWEQSDAELAKDATYIACHNYTREEEVARRKSLRRVRTLVARLRDRWPVVDLSGVSETLAGMGWEMQEVLGEMPAGTLPGDPPAPLPVAEVGARLPGTLALLVAAAARLSGRGRAEAADVATAWSVLGAHLLVISRICEMARRKVLSVPPDRPAEKAHKSRFTQILARFGGETVSVEQIAREMGVSVKLIQRDLELHKVSLRRRKVTLPAAPSAPAPLSAPPTAVVFEDDFVAVPRRFLPVALALEALPGEAQEQAASWLCDIALRDDLAADRERLQSLAAPLQAACPGLGQPLWEEVSQRLLDAEWPRRGRFALELYHAARLPDLRPALEARLGAAPALPLVLDRHVRALCHRLAVYAGLAQQGP